jgi:hypothetical protein
MLVELEELDSVLSEEELNVLLQEGLHKASCVLPAQKGVCQQVSIKKV